MNTLAAYLSVFTGRPYHGLQSAPFNKGSFWVVILALFFIGTCYALVRMFVEEGERKRKTLSDTGVPYSNADPMMSSK